MNRVYTGNTLFSYILVLFFSSETQNYKMFIINKNRKIDI